MYAALARSEKVGGRGYIFVGPFSFSATAASLGNVMEKGHVKFPTSFDDVEGVHSVSDNSKNGRGSCPTDVFSARTYKNYRNEHQNAAIRITHRRRCFACG